jgi:glycosyltransferase involved in cell wall biosynthesis
VEPEEAPLLEESERRALFGDAKVTLLYSGTLGRAHEFQVFLDVARRCRALAGDSVAVCFAGRGNRYEELRAAVTSDDTTVRLAPFCDEARLASRLCAADLHLMSLKPEWSGIAVPSKFFGSLAVGKPVLYAGAADSDIARWIEELDVGLVLTPQTIDDVAERLVSLAGDKSLMASWSDNARRAHQTRFSKRVVYDEWNRLLHGLLDYHRAQP